MGGRTLLVASGGGHLKQLKNLADRVPWTPASRAWITVDNPHSRSLLASENDVIFVPSARSRDLSDALINARLLRTYISKARFSHALSTGASLAVSVLPIARLTGATCHYIESAARVLGPSLSGRLLAHIPGVYRYAQYPGWVRHGWSYAGSVFDSFEPNGVAASPRLRRVVVTVGTLGDFSFRSLIEKLLEILPRETEILWQTGCTEVADLKIQSRPTFPAAEFSEHLACADVVVAHAGVGTALNALEAGKIPILVPRRARRREHVDDHQEQIARVLSDRGLARWLEVEQLSLAALLEASTARLKPCSCKPAPLNLRLS